MAILDGKPFDDKLIDPSKHRYIGMFRWPLSTFGGYNLICECGMHLNTYQSTYQHWSMGHLDDPQYETIKDNNNEIIKLKKIDFSEKMMKVDDLNQCPINTESDPLLHPDRLSRKVEEMD